jgi:hypothetical protein
MQRDAQGRRRKTDGTWYAATKNVPRSTMFGTNRMLIVRIRRNLVNEESRYIHRQSGGGKDPKRKTDVGGLAWVLSGVAWSLPNLGAVKTLRVGKKTGLEKENLP